MKIDEFDKACVTLDTYNSDLNLIIDPSRYSAHPLTNEGFAFMWAGVRATHGASSGKFCFEVKILNHIDVSHLPVDEPNTHVVRVGFSVNPSSLQLGEASLSYCYDGTGKISTRSRFKDFGQSFQTGDVILAAVNMDADVVQIGFAKNGAFLGWAYRISKRILKGRALFPHVLTKNVSFEVNFGQKETSYFPLPDIIKDYTFISCVPVKQRQSGTRPPKEIRNCEVIMMCGLPCAGKSLWAAQYSKSFPKKKYNILGTKTIIDKMKVMGLPRKISHPGNWDEIIQMATVCLNRMVEIASKLKRNYILDQTNVYPCARQMKMQNFQGFQFKAVVVIPSEVEYKRRCDKRYSEEGKQVPDEAILEMKANFKLPEVKDAFSEVIYAGLSKKDAEKLVAKYNVEGKAAVGPPRKQFKPSDQSSEYGNDRSLDSVQGNRNRSLGSGRRNHASSALGRNPQRDSESVQSENVSGSDDQAGNVSDRADQRGNVSGRGDQGGNVSGRSRQGGNVSGRSRRGENVSSRSRRGGNVSGRLDQGGNASGKGDQGGNGSGRGDQSGNGSGSGGQGGNGSGRGDQTVNISGRGGDQTENCSYSTSSGQMNTEVSGAPMSDLATDPFDFHQEDLFEERDFGFPPSFPPTFVSDTYKELWGLPNSLQRVQPQPRQGSDQQDSESSSCHGSLNDPK